MNQKLIYQEPIRFSRSNGEQQKTDQQFTMTCSCGANFSVPHDIVGSSAACPKCGKSVKISDEDFMPITCGCGKNLRVPRPTAGAGKKCPACKKPIKLLIMRPAQSQPEKSVCERPAVISTEKIEQSVEKADDKSKQVAQKLKDNHIKVRCPCGKKLAVPLAVAHQPIECPQCHSNFRLSRKYFIRISCSCGKEFKILRIFEGKSCTCPKCGKQQDAATALSLKPAG